MLVCFFQLKFDRRRAYTNFIIKALQRRKCMYLGATLSRLDPSGSWGWQWKSPGQHRRTTPSHTLLPNSVSASKATLQTQQGLEQVWFHSIMRQCSRRSSRLYVFTTSVRLLLYLASTVANCLLKKAPVGTFSLCMLGFSPGTPPTVQRHAC